MGTHTRAGIPAGTHNSQVPALTDGTYIQTDAGLADTLSQDCLPTEIVTVTS
jgi:hypothetical protein